MVRIALLLLIAGLICLPLAATLPVTPPPAPDAGTVVAAPDTPLVSAQAAVLIDRQTGLVLWGKNVDEPLPMASTTKIMSAMVILDHGIGRLNEPVTVSHHAASAGGSSQFREGETATLGDLLQASLIASSNEATLAAAEYLGGNEETFVGWMNDKARELGLQHTHFVNPHGLWDKQLGAEHYSSAHDLALIARCALTNYPLIRQIVNSGHIAKPVIIYTAAHREIILVNHNKLLGQPIPGIQGSAVDGVKTGFVNKSGHCLVCSATQQGWQLIAVVLNSPQCFKECQTLLYQGFRRYRWRNYVDAEQIGLTLPVKLGAGIVPVGAQAALGAPVLRLEFGETADDKVVFDGGRLQAPVKKGQLLGDLVLMRDGREIARAKAIALRGVPVAWWIRLLRGAGVTALSLFTLFVAGSLYGAFAKNARRRRRHLAARGGRADHGRTGYRQR